MKLSIAIILFVTVIYGCQYKNFETLHPEGETISCDTLSVSYSKDIQPLITQHCIRCHSTTASDASGGGIALDNYDNMNAYGEIAYAAIIGPKYYMPLGGPKVDTCNIIKLKKWISSGKLK